MPVRKYQEFIPHSTLQDSVKRFWVLEKEYTTADPIEEVTPDACVELIFNFGRPYSVFSNRRFRATGASANLPGWATKQATETRSQGRSENCRRQILCMGGPWRNNGRVS